MVELSCLQDDELDTGGGDIQATMKTMHKGQLQIEAEYQRALAPLPERDKFLLDRLPIKLLLDLLTVGLQAEAVLLMWQACRFEHTVVGGEVVVEVVVDDDAVVVGK